MNVVVFSDKSCLQWDPVENPQAAAVAYSMLTIKGVKPLNHPAIIAILYRDSYKNSINISDSIL